MMIRKALLSTLFVAALAGCGGRAFDYHPQSEIPVGPGLLSGEKGHFVLYSDEEKKKQKEAAATPTSEVAADFQEFKEYEEFRRWKATAKDGPEYREFQDWREWKAYRTWKERKR